MYVYCNITKNLLSLLSGRMNYSQPVDKTNNKKIKRLELFILKDSSRLIVVGINLRHKSKYTFEF